MASPTFQWELTPEQRQDQLSGIWDNAKHFGLSSVVRPASPLAAAMLAGAGIGAGAGLLGGGVGAIPGAIGGAAAGAGAYGGSKLIDLFSRGGNAAGNFAARQMGLPGDSEPVILPGQMYDEAIGAGLDYMGIPRPESPAERITSSAVGSVADMAGGAGLGKALMKGAAPIVQNAGKFLAAGTESPIGIAQNTAMAAGSGAAAQTVHEAAPNSTYGPAIAGLAAPFVVGGGSNLLKSGIRGSFSPAETAANADAFRNATGRSATVGQATQAFIPQAIESLSGKILGGNFIMSNTGRAQEAGMRNNLMAKADMLDPTATATSAGTAVNQAINKAANQGGIWRNEQDALYNNFKGLFNSASPGSTSNYAAALADATKPKMAGTAQGLALDAENTIKSGYAKNYADDVAKGNHNWSFDYKKQLRQDLDDKIHFGSSDPSLNEAQLRKLRFALTRDMEADAKAAGPDAYAAWKKADAYTQALNDKLDVLMPLVRSNKATPENTFVNLTQPQATKFGASKMGMALEALPDDAYRTFVAAHMKERLGRPLDGSQNAAGTGFSSETALRNWVRMSPEAKQALYGRLGPDFLKDMNTIAATASAKKEGGRVFANGSNTASVNTAMFTVGSLGTALASGDPKAALLSLVLPTLGTAGATVMTNPAVVRFLARNSRTSIGAALPQIDRNIAMAQQNGDERTAKDFQAVKGALQGGNSDDDLSDLSVSSGPEDLSDLAAPTKPSRAKRMLGE